MTTNIWPHTDDPYRAAWADVYRYVQGNDDLLDLIADKHNLDEVPPWTETDPVDQRLLEAQES